MNAYQIPKLVYLILYRNCGFVFLARLIHSAELKGFLCGVLDLVVVL